MRGIAVKFFVPLSILGLLASCVVLVIMLFMRNSNLELAGIKAGESLASQIITVRGFYTKGIPLKPGQSGKADTQRSMTHFLFMRRRQLG